MTEFKPAKREAIRLLVGLAGPTGSGKTFSALRLASGLAGDERFALIDTENGRALHYADQFEFDHAALGAPFTPASYADAIGAADDAGYPVIVVDSTSHEHAGEGGLLDMHDDALRGMGGRESSSMAAWVEPKREHKAMVNRLLRVKAHVILCFRAEEKVEMAKEGNRTVVRPKRSLVGLDGWVPVAEKNLPYELTLSLLFTADVPGVPKPIKLQEQHRLLLPLDAPLAESAGVALATWARGGSSEMDEEAARLTARLLSLAETLGKREETLATIQKHRQRYAADTHLTWLGRQFTAAEEKVAALPEPEIALGEAA